MVHIISYLQCVNFCRVVNTIPLRAILLTGLIILFNQAALCAPHQRILAGLITICNEQHH